MLELSKDLVSQFAKIIKEDKNVKGETTVFGTTVLYNGSMHVKLDGSDLLTPVTTTTDMKAGERVIVMIKNHSATVTGNISSPAARTEDVKDLDIKVQNVDGKVTEFENVVAYTVTTKDFEAINATIDSLRANIANIKDLEVLNAYIDTLEAKYASLDKVTAKDAEILNAEIENLEAKFGEFTELSADDIEAINANIANLKSYNATFTYVSADVLHALKAEINELDTKKLSAESADIKYANIDFTNIGKAAMEYLYAESGLIKNVTVGDQTITGELVGVTIKGDLIEGNTIKADKLVVKGSDGLYYKLNFNSGNFESAEEVPTDTLHGSVITANSITAEKISVKDLVALGATIGGFKITENSIYSGVKESVSNTTKGIYLDNDGQIALGDSNNFLKYYKDAEGKYHLEISASSMKFSSRSETIENIVTESELKANEAIDKANTIQDRVDSGEFDAVTLRIDSSRGTVFKNNAISTVLNVVIFKGSRRITDSKTMYEVFGPSARLEWKWQKMDENSFGIIVPTDSRLSDNGFMFALSPSDIDTKAVFSCDLITE